MQMNRRRMNTALVLGSGLLLAAAGRAALAQQPLLSPPIAPTTGGKAAPPASGAASGGYRLGDRLGGAKVNAADYTAIDWDALMPKDWDPMKTVQNLNFALMKDSDPRAIDALKKLREAWDNAPVNPALNQRKVRIPGFVVPLDAEGGKMREFLLVPYFGACIHTPPPPVNQVIHVTAAQPVAGIQAMSPVWVSGLLEVERVETGMGVSGYVLSGDKVEPYKEPPPKR